MAKEIIWTPEAISTFENVIEYLEREWTEKEVRNFIQATYNVIEYISIHPEMFRRTNKKNVHEALVTPHNLLIYKVSGKTVYLTTFWDTRRDPRKKPSRR